jgi:hypothetical protein
MSRFGGLAHVWIDHRSFLKQMVIQTMLKWDWLFATRFVWVVLAAINPDCRTVSKLRTRAIILWNSMIFHASGRLRLTAGLFVGNILKPGL